MEFLISVHEETSYLPPNLACLRKIAEEHRTDSLPPFFHPILIGAPHC